MRFFRRAPKEQKPLKPVADLIPDVFAAYARANARQYLQWHGVKPGTETELILCNLGLHPSRPNPAPPPERYHFAVQARLNGPAAAGYAWNLLFCVLPWDHEGSHRFEWPR